MAAIARGESGWSQDPETPFRVSHIGGRDPRPQDVFHCIPIPRHISGTWVESGTVGNWTSPLTECTSQHNQQLNPLCHNSGLQFFWLRHDWRIEDLTWGLELCVWLTSADNAYTAIWRSELVDGRFCHCAFQTNAWIFCFLFKIYLLAWGNHSVIWEFGGVSEMVPFLLSLLRHQWKKMKLSEAASNYCSFLGQSLSGAGNWSDSDLSDGPLSRCNISCFVKLLTFYKTVVMTDRTGPERASHFERSVLYCFHKTSCWCGSPVETRAWAVALELLSWR